MRRAGLAMVVLTLSVGLLPAAASAARPKAADRALDRALAGLVAKPGGPPGAIVLVRRGGVTHVHRAGVADLKTGRRWRPSDHMRLASVAKAYSGAVALSLVKRGRLNLDDTIGEILPSPPVPWGAVTVRQLLQHTSGLPNYTDIKSFQHVFAADLKRHFTPRQLVDYAATAPLTFAPGTSYEYSNTDNIVIALMAEAVSGRSYDGLLRSLVYRPLGLSATSLPTGFRLPRPFAHGYQVEPGEPSEDVSELVGMSGVWASGAIVSTPTQLMRFIRGYVGGRLFGPAIRRAQRRFRPGGSDPTGPGVNAAGLALFRYRMPCGTVYGHTGNFFGYTQFAAASANGRRAVTVSVNNQLSQGAGVPAAFHRLRGVFQRAACAALARP